MRFATARLFALMAVMPLVGCGEPGPERYPVGGSVTWHGQPVPAGYLIFTPDVSQGNAGPGSQAEIVDGRYATTEANGPIAGAHLVTIYGFDGQAYQDGPVMVPTGRPLFGGYETQVQVSDQGHDLDFAIPRASRRR